jgi:hypothetical protein
MSNVQQLLESSANSWKSLQSDAAKLAGKWSKTGLLEGLVEMDKNNMSLLLENQAKQLVTESNQISSNSSFVSNGQGENWAGIALPLVRKVFGTIVAKEFVSVQPMNMPSGLVFFLDFQYGNTKTPFTAGQSLYGTRNTASQFPFSTPAADGGLYGTGRFTYSTNQFSASVPLTGSANGGVLPTVSASNGTVVTASWAELNFDSTYSASVVANGIYKVTVTTASVLTAFDQDAVRGFILDYPSASFSSASLLPQFTTYNYTAGTIAFFYTGSATITAGALSASATVYYEKAGNVDGIPTYSGGNNFSGSGRGDFEASGSFSVPNAANAAQIVIPEINVRMQSQAITAKTKKLKAVWTPEFAQDLAAYQNIDAEAELTNIMSEYISMEIDLEILDMLIEDAAAATEYWSATNNTVYNPSSNAFAAAATTQAFYNTQGQWFQTLGTKIQKVSNKIHQLTLRGGASFLVTSPTIATILESIPGFASTSNGEADQMEYAFGVQKIGTVNGRYKVYKNPYLTENLILMGYRGSQFLETGAVFAPYIPLIMTPLVYDPDTFTPRKGLLTRYAKKMLRPEFYGKIYVNGLNTI